MGQPSCEALLLSRRAMRIPQDKGGDGEHGGERSNLDALQSAAHELDAKLKSKGKMRGGQENSGLLSDLCGFY